MPGGKPNIVVIWGDDIGISNLSGYSDGSMGCRTPNIDRIADEGMRFTESCGEQSCPELLHRPGGGQARGVPRGRPLGRP
jgi:arylsulfatase A-like enzyme